MNIADIWSWLSDPLRAASYAGLTQPVRLHGLLMALAAGVLMPLAVLIARYFKILPSQDWPRELNRRSGGSAIWCWPMAHRSSPPCALVLVVLARPEGANHLWRTAMPWSAGCRSRCCSRC